MTSCTKMNCEKIDKVASTQIKNQFTNFICINSRFWVRQPESMLSNAQGEERIEQSHPNLHISVNL